MSSGKQLILGLTLIPLSVSYGYVLNSLVNEYSVLLLVGIEYVYGMCVCVCECGIFRMVMRTTISLTDVSYFWSILVSVCHVCPFVVLCSVLLICRVRVHVCAYDD